MQKRHLWYRDYFEERIGVTVILKIIIERMVEDGNVVDVENMDVGNIVSELYRNL